MVVVAVVAHQMLVAVVAVLMESHGDPAEVLTACAESLRENSCFVPISTCMLDLCFYVLGLVSG
jgi:hypothetical protein